MGWFGVAQVENVGGGANFSTNDPLFRTLFRASLYTVLFAQGCKIRAIMLFRIIQGHRFWH